MKGFVGIEEKVLFIKQKWLDLDEVPVPIVSFIKLIIIT